MDSHYPVVAWPQPQPTYYPFYYTITYADPKVSYLENRIMYLERRVQELEAKVAKS